MRFTFLLSLVSVSATGALLYSGWKFFRSEFPDVSVLRTHYPAILYQGQSHSERVVLKRETPEGWVRLAEISKAAVGAVIVSEDWAFYQHKGYDANQIKEAVTGDIGSGKALRGASTITQQVVKNVFLTRERSLWRKIKELLLATRLENAVSKNRILEIYLNIAEWGDGIYGMRAAARHYFHKAPSELTAKEGAFLSMLLPSPKRYAQSFKSRQLTDYARRTVGSILEKMMQARYITEEQRMVEAYTPLSFEQSPGGSSL